MQTTPDTKRRKFAAKEIKAFTGQLRNLIAFADEIDEAYSAEATVQNARQELAGLQARIEKAKIDIDGAEAEAARRIAEHQAKAERAIGDFEAALDTVRIAHAENLVAVEAEHQRAVAAAGERQQAAEDSASAAEHRLRQLNADIEAAAARRDSVRAELAAAANALAR